MDTRRAILVALCLFAGLSLACGQIGATTPELPASTPLPTFTPMPQAPTATWVPTWTPTTKAKPTEEVRMATIALTATRRPQPTATPVPGAVGGVCRCDSDRYNCGDFSGHDAAQACYNLCLSLGKGDVHKLDRDGDGKVCEN